MQHPITPPAAAAGSRISTDEFGAQLKVTAQGIRKRLCMTGSYWGVRPIKLPNGRLMWPADAVERLIGGAQ